MRILITPENSVLIAFSDKELRVALQVLRALYAATKQSFIQEAIEDVEAMLTPRVPYIITHRLCESCCCEIDLKNDQHIVRDGVYRHTVCPTLKPDSTRER